MKTVILALLVVLAVSQSEALICNCGGRKTCANPVETCSGPDPVCGNVVVNAGNTSYFFKGCMEGRRCRNWDKPGIAFAVCCKIDQCN